MFVDWEVGFVFCLPRNHWTTLAYSFIHPLHPKDWKHVKPGPHLLIQSSLDEHESCGEQNNDAKVFTSRFPYKSNYTNYYQFVYKFVTFWSFNFQSRSVVNISHIKMLPKQHKIYCLFWCILIKSDPERFRISLSGYFTQWKFHSVRILLSGNFTQWEFHWVEISVSENFT